MSSQTKAIKTQYWYGRLKEKCKEQKGEIDALRAGFANARKAIDEITETAFEEINKLKSEIDAKDAEIERLNAKYEDLLEVSVQVSDEQKLDSLFREHGLA